MKDWTFQDKNIAREFDSHVREQLPWYDLATEATACLVRNYLSSGGIVYDIGASTGNIGIAISDIVKERNAKFIAIEQSVEMAQAYKGGGDLFVEDAVDFNYDPFSVAIIFLG
jgi:tRNA (cmo5U34)-methyltransferase